MRTSSERVIAICIEQPVGVLEAKPASKVFAGRLAGCSALATMLAGCGGWQSSLDPQGPQAHYLADLFWTFAAVLTLVWLATILVLAWAVRSRRGAEPDPLATDSLGEQRASRWVGLATIATVAILLALTGLSYAAQRHLFSSSPADLSITITGHQWWWEIRYENADPIETVVTANELHLPVGKTVSVNLAAADVIHSFWVPNLFGKRDLIPGLQNTIWLTPARQGIWRGQCAEFCGSQHAHMGLFVIVEDAPAFERWRAGQLTSAAAPAGTAQQAGEGVFLSSSCGLCHTVRGTAANGRVGPDLTHLASRQHIAAAALLLSRNSLLHWVRDPHAIKPGVHMPATEFQDTELHALVSYLEDLR